jgi:predicted acylesterase/phospholipase RssA
MTLRFTLAFLLLHAATALAQDVGSTSLRHDSASLPHPPGVALVLSGGGIKGFAHIGVLDVLDSAHVPIDLIVGTSIGAVIGGLYADGYTPKQLEAFAKSINWADVLEIENESDRAERVLSQKDMDHALLSLRFRGFFEPVIPQAISSGQRLTMLLNSMVLGAPAGVPNDFLRDLRVPFVAVTTDIVRGERRLLTDGDLTEALRASATLPLRFSPVPEDSAILMDGGLLDNIPTDVAKSFGASKIIVSNTTAPLLSRESLNTPWDVADQVTSLMMRRENARELKLSDCTITPDFERLDGNDFANIPASIEAGRQAARAMLPQIMQTIASVQKQVPSSTSDEILLPALREVRIIGKKHKFLDTAIAACQTISGLPLTRSGTMKTVERHMLEAYRSHGYSLARIDSVVLRTSIGRADVYIDEGHVARVVVRGSDSDFVLHELAFHSGDVFRAASGERSLHDLTGTGLFDFEMLQISYDSEWPGTRYIQREDTLAEPSTSSSFEPTVILTVRSKSPNVIRLGVYADNEFGAEFSAELANENIGGTGLEYSLVGSLGPLARSASFTFDAPRLFHSFGVLDASVYSGYRDITAYSITDVMEHNETRVVSNVTDVVRETRDLGVQIRAGGQIERLGALSVEFRAEHQRWFSTRDSSGDHGSDNLRAFRGELLVDSRDDEDYPHTGTLLRGYAETGLSLLGEGTNYAKFFGELEEAIPISSLHTVIPHLQLGIGNGLIPRIEEFELGGIRSFYGLNQYELRGQQMIEGSLTYQIAIPHVLFFPTFVSARYDIGATWPEPTQVKFESLLHGIGAQVGLKTPLGLAEFGIGENFRFIQNQSSTPLKVPGDAVALNTPDFYFSIGARL